jgi:hypothetical protein
MQGPMIYADFKCVLCGETKYSVLAEIGNTDSDEQNLENCCIDCLIDVQEDLKLSDSEEQVKPHLTVIK